ncbi:MAG: ABC transporter permease [Acidimicrobiales bacterium]
MIVLGTTDPSNLQAVGSGTVQVESGGLFAAASDENVAVIGRGLAEKNGLSVGSTFTAYGATLTVSGVFSAGNTFGDNAAIVPLRTLQRLSGQPGAGTAATVQVDSINNLPTAQAAISAALGEGADVVSQQDTSEQALEPLNNIRSISSFSLTGAVVAGATIIFLTC